MKVGIHNSLLALTEPHKTGLNHTIPHSTSVSDQQFSWVYNYEQYNSVIWYLKYKEEKIVANKLQNRFRKYKIKKPPNQRNKIEIWKQFKGQVHNYS